MWALPRLEAAEDVLVGRLHGERRCELLDDLSRRPRGLAQAVLLDPRPDRVAVLALELLRQRRVEPLRLAGLRPQLLLRLAELADLLVREVERLEQLLVRHLVRAGLDHRQAVLRADDDEVERAVRLALLERRHDELAVDQRDADGAHRAEERQRRDHQRRGGAVDAEDVVRRDHVRREGRADDLHLVAEALRPERPDRAVDHARSEDGALVRRSLALETAEDLPGGVHPLLDVDGEREEVGALAGLRAALRGGEDHGVALADDDGAVGLLGELAGLERDLVRPTWTETRLRLSAVAILIWWCPPLLELRGEWGLEPDPGWSSLESPPSVYERELAAEAELLDEGAVALEIVLLEVVQEAAAAPHSFSSPRREW